LLDFWDSRRGFALCASV